MFEFKYRLKNSLIIIDVFFDEEQIIFLKFSKNVKVKSVFKFEHFQFLEKFDQILANFV